MICFFVYGTLKRGEANERVWPHQPTAVHPAILDGARLYDLGAYPAMVRAAAGHRVKGEVWCFDDAEAAAECFARLDRLEGYEKGRSRGNLYDREQVTVMLADGEPGGYFTAWTYFYARPAYLTKPVCDDGTTAEWKGGR